MGEVVHYRDFKRTQHWAEMEMPNLLKMSPEEYARKWRKMGEILHYRDFKKPAARWSNMEMPNLLKMSQEEYARKWLIADTSPCEYDPAKQYDGVNLSAHCEYNYTPPEKDPA